MISDAAVTSDVYVILIEFFYIVLLMDTHTAYTGNKAPIRFIKYGITKYRYNIYTPTATRYHHMSAVVISHYH